MSAQTISLESFDTFGEFLKFLRRRERLTQLELSIEVGYSEAQISRLEKNQRLPDLAALKALFIPALHLEDEPVLSQRLLDLAQVARQEDLPSPGAPPYKGLLFFDEADANLFFGREALIARLTARLNAPIQDSTLHFLAIIGASGSGKSSLVRAGLVPNLKRAGWDTCVFTPTEQPLKMLADQLHAIPPQRHPEKTLILVDQFEEVFTLCRDESARSAYIENLLTLAQTTAVVVTLRADFYGYCAQYPHLREAVASSQAYIGPMTAAELRLAIEKPAIMGGWELGFVHS